MNEWKNEYDNLLWRYRDLQSRYEKQGNELNKANSELQEKTFTINEELKPRIEREKRGYDMTRGMEGTCFSWGQAGKCGEDCPEYGSQEECDD